MSYHLTNPAPPELPVGRHVWFWDNDAQDVCCGRVTAMSYFHGNASVTSVRSDLTGREHAVCPDRIWPDEEGIQKAYAAAREANVKELMSRIHGESSLLAACLAHDVTRADTPERADLREAVIRTAEKLGLDKSVFLTDPFPEVEEATEYD